jgi:hypothetical protein
MWWRLKVTELYVVEAKSHGTRRLWKQYEDSNVTGCLHKLMIWNIDGIKHNWIYHIRRNVFYAE